MSSQPALEDRFLQPQNWSWDSMEREGRKLRLGHMNADTPKKTIVCLHGLSEFSEKYFEFARWATEQGWNFYTFDWMGQGKSDRYLPDPNKRHSSGFEDDIADLQFIIDHHIPKDTPLVMLAHSTGANIGLRYLENNKTIFETAIFTAPLFGIAEVPTFLLKPALALSRFFKSMMPESYVPGGKEWNKELRENSKVFSSDPQRSKLQNAWSLHDTALQVGSPTWGWLHDALNSCVYMKGKDTAENVTTPSLFFTAGDDKVVNNDPTRDFVERMPNAKIINLPGAQHEILMEHDRYRDTVLAAIKDHIESLD